MFRKSNIILACLLISAGNLYGQNFTVKSYSTADGLPHNNVRAIARDSSGFLWIGTWDGLSRFDGHEFRNYFHEPDDSTSIPYFSINNLCVDKCNNLWIITDTRELVQYNRGTDDFKTFRAVNSIPLDNINNISTDPEGNLLIALKSSIIIRDPLKKELTVLKLTGCDTKPYVIENQKNWITMIGDSAIFLIGSVVREFRKSGINQYLLYKEYPIEKVIDEPIIHFDATIWRSIYVSPSGSKWLFSNNGLFRLDKKTGTFMEYLEEFSKNEFTGTDFFFWGKRNNGIYFYDPKDQKLTHLPDHQARWPAVILPVGKDSFWFSNSTPQGVALGVSRVAFIQGYFRNTLITASDSSNPAVYSVVADKYGKVWAGIRGFDHIVRYDTDNTVTGINFLDEKALSLSVYLRSMIPVKDGIWLGYFLNLLQFYDYKTENFIKHNADASGFRAIAVNKDGNLLIGTNKLLMYHPSSGKTDIMWQSPDVDGMFKIYPDSAGIIWCCLSNSRLLKYNPLTGEDAIIKVAPGISNIEDVIPGGNGDLWLALLGKGVCRYNTIKGTFKYYTTAAGLSNNTTYSLQKDRNGHIWVSTNHGISMIHPETDRIRTFDETDGIAISEFNSGAKFISEDGEFFFGGMGGFVRFYPDSISLSEEISQQQLLLTNLEVSGVARHLQGDLNETDTIILDRGENNFHLSFSSTDFINSDKTIFRYKLSPVNRKWIATSSRNRNINYSNLRPGWYDLIIEADDRNGDWTASRKITFRIKPSFYQTRVFRTLMPLLILGIFVFSIILYVRQVKQKERSKQDELKLQSLRSQMNPHFIFNSLNSINYFISNNDRLSANRYIADFSRLIRSILSNMGSNFIPLEDEINSLMDYLRIEHLRFSDKFDYNLDISEISNMSEIEICPGIVQPFIENAIWHGVRALEDRKGKISIRFIKSGSEGLKCIIEDDGIGINASMKNKGSNVSHKPKGIGIIEERLQITGKLRKTNYRLVINDLYPERKETGTRVEVDIPAKPSKIRT